MIARSAVVLAGAVSLLLGREPCLADEVRFKERCLAAVVEAVPGILKSQDAATGRFGSGIWVVNDQQDMIVLAAAWAAKDPRNPFYHNEDLLKAILAAGDALIDDQDAEGRWEFRKKDGSTWGKIYMPWVYSRWIRSYGLIREAMPPDRRARWLKALELGFSGISRTALNHIQNIPAHHAMSLYFAGRLLGKPEWMDQAKAFIAKVVAAQHPDGYWSENVGPVVNYNFVYVDAVGTYYAASGDESVLPALRKAALFHLNFTYPDGTPVETVDERNPYHKSPAPVNVGFTVTPEGRAYVARQLRCLDKAGLPADSAATLLLYGTEGPGAPSAIVDGDHDYVLGKGAAAIRRRGPWFLVLSAMCCPVRENRWIQDRQNLLSIYHDKVGLVVGGGNTKLQPRWSTFAVGDPGLLHHTPGDERPKFAPPEGIIHVPTAARLVTKPDWGLDLEYGKQRCTVRLEILDGKHLEIRWRAEGPCPLPTLAHLTVLPRLDTAVRSATGRELILESTPFLWDRGQAGPWIEHAGVRFGIPGEAAIRWPVLPHNPYRKDGRASAAEGRLVVEIPFGPTGGKATTTLEIR